MKPLRIAIICDFAEEQWLSMDLTAQLLFDYLRREKSATVRPALLRPPFQRLFTGLPLWRRSWTVRNVERFINRFWNYPRWLRRYSEQFDVFHIIDQSYSHLVHHLPKQRTIVTCHDLDVFRCLLEPLHAPRSRLVKLGVSRILDGLRKAAMVSCVTNAIRQQVVSHGLMPIERTETIRNGIDPTFRPEGDGETESDVNRLIGAPDERRAELLHVSSAIPRKRIDVLLKVFAALIDQVPRARLIHVGGTFTPDQVRLMQHLELQTKVISLPLLPTNVLASLYRRAAVCLLPSEAEGFGLPVAESMACGTPVLASDLDSLREVGGEAAVYCPVAEVEAWKDGILTLLKCRSESPCSWMALRNACVRQASQFTWSESASRTVKLYQHLCR
jgi:glycosyltransferase involved in cell wall biosynthesis